MTMSEITNDKSSYPASETAIVVRSESPTALSTPATTDDRIIDLWVHGRSRHTQRAYRADAGRFMASSGKRLAETTLADLQAFADTLATSGCSPATKNRVLSSIKSLFSFAHRLGYLAFDVAEPLRVASLRNTLAERILDESDLHRMIALERQPRNHVLLLLVYASGIRVSEVCGLRWRDCQARNGGGQITVLGKGDKTRTILLPTRVFGKLMALRNGAGEESPCFLSRRRRAISPSQVLRIVKNAARRAELNVNVVVHTLRHCHASHALEHGAPIHLVQQTLGHCSVATTGRYLHARPTESSSTFLPL